MKPQSSSLTHWWNIDQHLELEPVKGEKGSYLLHLFAKEEISISKPRTGLLDSGHYLYCGSARNGLLKRINRHLLKNKRIWWHIDQITGNSRVIRVFWTETYAECELSWKLRQIGIKEPVRGFGSSDCDKSCYSHFFSLEHPDQFNWRVL